MSVLKIKDDGVWKDIPTIVGEAAGFGTVTATVDANHGTPSVTVTTSGEDTAKNFTFDFKNLQPAPYDDSELQNDFAILQGQFDTAVSAVTTDTEVTDIRVGADGITYTTAGASVRRQFTDLKSAISDISEPTRNLNNAKMGNYGSGTDGNIYPRSDKFWGMDKPIEVSGNTSYYISFYGFPSNSLPCFMFQDASRTILARNIYGNLNNRILVSPANSKYFYIHVESSTNTIPSTARIQVEKGTYQTAYINPETALDYISRNSIDSLEIPNVIGSIVDIAESYFDVCYDPNDSLVYDTMHGMWTDIYDGNGDKSIVCSHFSQAVFSAVPYKNSRYVLGSASPNISLPWGAKTDGSGSYYNLTDDYCVTDDSRHYCKDFMKAAKQEEYFRQKGIIHDFDIDHNDVKDGDIIFWKESAFTTEELEEDPVVHVAIVLDAEPDAYSFMHANSGYVRLCDGVTNASLQVTRWNWNRYTPYSYVHMDDVIKIKPSFRADLLWDKPYNFSQSMGSSTLFVDTITISLPRGFYTLVFDCGDGNSNPYIRVNYTIGGTTETKSYYGTTVCGRSKFTFYAEADFTSFDIRFDGGTLAEVKGVKMYKGYHA